MPSDEVISMSLEFPERADPGSAIQSDEQFLPVPARLIARTLAKHVEDYADRDPSVLAGR